MIRFFLFIKENIPFLWKWIEGANGFVFAVLFASRFSRAEQDAFKRFRLEGFVFRPVAEEDLPALGKMILSQDREELHYFEAHEFDTGSLRRMLRNPSFLMMAVFDEGKLIGYFFLRCLVNKKCFVGRMVDKAYRKRGVGRVMNEIMYNTAWDARFRCFATVSEKNLLVMNAHKVNPRVVFRGELPDHHILIEFVDKKKVV
ncbi:MAG: GNAT family N-acetyltransferase [Bacteroidales bacterium]|nr:GNAT family N-acetyltransferase [Bacteroidales bacterium]